MRNYLLKKIDNRNTKQLGKEKWKIIMLIS